ncbi:nucleotidyl transferase AbiEii/AbiGii toxin family protein [Parabacteroides sp.]|uniref:nucleotidyl transferase AbiEii/AbiGii toxin family protein n=1 Tax=Parabacteroides sp. TaxID=1869337 RepID=UPI002580166E|nr:nucleotidyl transferase AbiEii/AbiGii toxin family protein [Parabacteroides sp.]
MADRISCGWDFLARVFQEILGIVCHEDGVSFDAGSIKIEPITVEKKYFGTRFYFTAHVNIQAYSLETVIAEKFHTMIDRDVLNSRMKDFFDCYQLLTKRNLNDDALYDAIEATFDNRGLAYNPDLQLFTDSFATDGARISRWKAFLRKIQWKEALDFDTVMKVIRDRLQPMAERYWIKLSK